MSGAYPTVPVFRLFVSSTFADFKAEREALRKDVFPAVQVLCAEHGARFEVVDLRWGVSQAAARAHTTMDICLGELRRCQATGLAPNLLILLGDRYGSRLLPETITQADFAVIQRRLASLAAGRRPLAHLDRWYRLDRNATPAVYRLQPRPGGRRGDSGGEDERQLDELIRKGAEALPARRRRRLTASATEREVAAGVFENPRGRRQVLCCFRRLVPRPPGRAARGSLDVNREGRIDREAQGRLRELKNRLRAGLPRDRMLTFRARWGRGGVDKRYLSRFCRRVRRRLERDVREQLSRWRGADPLDLEVRAHLGFARGRARDFVGRRDDLRRIANYLGGDDRWPLVVHGAPGSGKSSLLARALEPLRSGQGGAAVVVYRSVGATGESHLGATLLDGLCRELARAYGRRFRAPATGEERDRLLARYLRLASRRRPIVVVVDALDQLRAGDEARYLRWVPATLPAHARLIVSTSPSGALDLLRRKLRAAAFHALSPLLPREGAELLHRWLGRAGRRLTPIQRRRVLRAFARSGSPLHLHLMVQEARAWRSADRPGRLPGNVEGMVRRLLSRLSQDRQHGRLLVERSLAYLAASRNGLSWEEVRAILSTDGEVMAQFRARHPWSPRTGRELPALIWSRLFHDLADYLAYRRADGHLLLDFFHGQVREVVTRAFLAPHRRHRHRHLAGHARRAYRREGEADRRVLSELPYQLCRGGLRRQAAATLLDARFIGAKIAAVGAEPLVEDLDLALDTWPGTAGAVRDLATVRRTLAQAAETLVPGGGPRWTELAGRLQADRSPGIRRLVRAIRRQVGGTWLRPVTGSLWTPGLVRSLRGHGARAAPGGTAYSDVWDLGVSPDGRTVVSASHDHTLRVFDTLTGRTRHELIGHQGQVLSVAVFDGGRAALSCSSDGMLVVWDLLTGGARKTLRGSKSGEWAVAVTPDGRLAFSGAGNGSLRVWDLHAGRRLRTWRGHRASVWRVAIAPDGRTGASGSQDGRLGLWRLRTGRALRILRLPQRADLVRAVQFAAGGRRVVAGTGGGALIVEDVEGRSSTRMMSVHAGVVRAVAVTPDGRHVVSASADRTVKVTDVLARRVLATVPGDGTEANAIGLGADGETLISGYSSGSLRVWHLPTLVRAARRIHEGRVQAVSVLRSGRTVVTGDTDGLLVAWDGRRGRTRARCRAHPEWIGSLAVAGGRHEVVSASTPLIVAWDTATRRRRVRELGNDEYGAVVTASPDGSLVAAVTSNYDVTVWSARDWTPVRTLRGPHGWWLRPLVITADKHFLVALGERTLTTREGRSVRRRSVWTWDLRTGQRGRLPGSVGRGARALFGAGQGRVLTASADGALRLWDVASQRQCRVFPARGHRLSALDVGRDGRHAVSGSPDGSLRWWDLATGRSRVVPGDGSRVTGVWLLPGNRSVVATSSDRLVVWDLERGQPLGSFTANAPLGPCAVLPDGRTIVAAEATGAVHFLRLENVARRTG